MSATQPTQNYDHEFFKSQFAHQKSLAGTIERVTEYTKSQAASDVLIKVVSKTLKKASCFAVAGGTAGAVFGGVTAGPPGALTCGVEGAKLGAILGLVYSAYVETNYVLEEYQTWKAEHQRDKVWEKLKELGREQGLGEFECPITLDWIVNPAVTCCGHKFEYQDLVENLENVHRCPTCNLEEGLTFCAAPHITVAFERAVSDIIRSEGQNSQIPVDARQGFNALSHDLARISERQYRKACNELHKLRQSGEISLMAYDRHLNIIDSIFYPEDGDQI